ncbi:hypothetical protein CSB45_07315 [candidate division KSB3 bacterium]|uniref:Uncharacterized protein n=1 Tax=candidate division KSB3 bacterium TaxID=2044937 RepID=A0A2G6E6F6_9BACT|nr:MAG: hypothetical protein CSB45_07315 [candidate division KSB3 bacterium]
MRGLFHILPPFAPDYSGVCSTIFDLDGLAVIYDVGDVPGRSQLMISRAASAVQARSSAVSHLVNSSRPCRFFPVPHIALSSRLSWDNEVSLIGENGAQMKNDG